MRYYIVRSEYTDFNSSSCCQRSIRTVASILKHTSLLNRTHCYSIAPNSLHHEIDTSVASFGNFCPRKRVGGFQLDYSTKIGRSVLPRVERRRWGHNCIHMEWYVAITDKRAAIHCQNNEQHLHFIRVTQRLFFCLLLILTENLINDVHIHPTGGCLEDDAILVGYQSGATYTFTTADGGKELFFANDVGRRCEDGQNIKVLVSQATAAQISSIQEGISAATKIRAFSALTMAVGFAATLIL